MVSLLPVNKLFNHMIIKWMIKNNNTKWLFTTAPVGVKITKTTSTPGKGVLN